MVFAMPAALKENIGPAFGQIETRLWLQLLSLHGDIFSSLNSVLGSEFGLSLAKFDKTLAAIKLVEKRDDAADWARRLREAALKDSVGKELDGVIQTIKTFA